MYFGIPYTKIGYTICSDSYMHMKLLCSMKLHTTFFTSFLFSPVSDGAYYLRNETAILELDLIDMVSEILRQHEITQFSNPDMVKTLVMVSFISVEMGIYHLCETALLCFCCDSAITVRITSQDW